MTILSLGIKELLLQQVWSLDPCTDDKSKSTIEKMILEEQYPLHPVVNFSMWCFPDNAQKHTHKQANKAVKNKQTNEQTRIEQPLIYCRQQKIYVSWN